MNSFLVIDKLLGIHSDLIITWADISKATTGASSLFGYHPRFRRFKLCFTFLSPFYFLQLSPPPPSHNTPPDSYLTLNTTWTWYQKKNIIKNTRLHIYMYIHWGRIAVKEDYGERVREREREIFFWLNDLLSHSLSCRANSEVSRDADNKIKIDLAHERWWWWDREGGGGRGG